MILLGAVSATGIFAIVLLIAIPVLSITLSPYFLNVYRNVRLENTFVELQNSFGGELVPTQQYPALKFHLEDQECFLWVVSGKANRLITNLQLPLPDPNLRLQVFPQGFWENLRVFMGMQDVVIGAGDFDQRYVIQSNRPPNQLQNILNLDARNEIDGIRGGDNQLQIVVSGRQLMVSVNLPSLDSYQFRTLVHRGQALQRFLCQGLGIQFPSPYIDSGIILAEPVLRGDSRRPPKLVQRARDEKPPLPLTSRSSASRKSRNSSNSPSARDRELPEAKCLVCGELAKLDLVHCVSCKTIHHRECFDYVGTCSIFACGSTRYSSLDR